MKEGRGSNGVSPNLAVGRSVSLLGMMGSIPNVPLKDLCLVAPFEVHAVNWISKRMKVISLIRMVLIASEKNILLQMKIVE